jgi:SRF-type transcription factor (DNA-binding and dimerisation domain)
VNIVLCLIVMAVYRRDDTKLAALSLSFLISPQLRHSSFRPLSNFSQFLFWTHRPPFLVVLNPLPAVVPPTSPPGPVRVFQVLFTQHSSSALSSKSTSRINIFTCAFPLMAFRPPASGTSNSTSYPYSNTTDPPLPLDQHLYSPHTMRKRQRTLDMNPANSAPADPNQPQSVAPGQPVTEDAFINDHDAGESGGDDDDDEEKPKEKKAGRRKIKIEFIQDKSRRHITFSKRKAGMSTVLCLAIPRYTSVFIKQCSSHRHYEKGTHFWVILSNQANI